MRLGLVFLLVVGCSDDGQAADAGANARVDAATDGPFATCSDPSFSLMGDACTEDPFPAITYCHHDSAGHPDGVCLDDGTCRPVCLYDGHRQCCPKGQIVQTDRGSCVCEP